MKKRFVKMYTIILWLMLTITYIWLIDNSVTPKTLVDSYFKTAALVVGAGYTFLVYYNLSSLNPEDILSFNWNMLSIGIVIIIIGELLLHFSLFLVYVFNDVAIPISLPMVMIGFVLCFIGINISHKFYKKIIF